MEQFAFYPMLALVSSSGPWQCMNAERNGQSTQNCEEVGDIWQGHCLRGSSHHRNGTVLVLSRDSVSGDPYHQYPVFLPLTA